ncbi:MAG: hypothetical protein Q4B66_01285 [Ligilactobacillus agilis]|nr:hypothetical protein [Ligilactobacillus agilis]
MNDPELIAQQIAQQIWPLFKRLPKTIYHLLIVNDQFDHQFNFFFEIFRPQLRSHSYPLASIPNDDLNLLVAIICALRTNEKMQIVIEYRGFEGLTWPNSQRKIPSHPYQTPALSNPDSPKNAPKPNLDVEKITPPLPLYSDEKAEQIATNFFKNEYVDYGMGKWHGFRTVNLAAEKEDFANLELEIGKHPLSQTAIVALLKLAQQEQLPVHLQLQVENKYRGINGLVLGVTKQTLFLKPAGHQLAIPLKLINSGELL